MADVIHAELSASRRRVITSVCVLENTRKIHMWTEVKKRHLTSRYPRASLSFVLRCLTRGASRRTTWCRTWWTSSTTWTAWALVPRPPSRWKWTGSASSMARSWSCTAGPIRGPSAWSAGSLELTGWSCLMLFKANYWCSLIYYALKKVFPFFVRLITVTSRLFVIPNETHFIF